MLDTEHPSCENAHDIQSVAFISLGCPKNLVDSEKMLGLLAEQGLVPVPSDDIESGKADAVVINTCGFLEAAKEESLEEIHQVIELKKQGLVKRVVVAGCLVQRHRAKILEWAPGIDALVGVFDRDQIVQAVRPQRTGDDLDIPLPVFSSISSNAASAAQRQGLGQKRNYYESDAARLRLTPRHYAYLRMSEGCNQGCAFCTIPSIRGRMRSKPVEIILQELGELMADGAFEIMLIGQDTTSYGEDIGYEQGLAGLLREIDSFVASRGGGWIRLMYAYPSTFTDDMIKAIAESKHILPYIDMPLQHISESILDSMRRKTHPDLIRGLLGKLRQIPNMVLRTTFISGYPGETADDHSELLQFIQSFEFDNLGVFPYSPEPGTKAGGLYDKGHGIDDDTIQARIEELMLAQQEIVLRRNEQMSEDETELDVLIDYMDSESELELEGLPANSQLYVGRHKGQAPDIDAITFVTTPQKLSPGEVVRCRTIGFSDYDLVTRPLEDIHRTISLPLSSDTQGSGCCG